MHGTQTSLQTQRPDHPACPNSRRWPRPSCQISGTYEPLSLTWQMRRKRGVCQGSVCVCACKCVWGVGCVCGGGGGPADSPSRHRAGTNPSSTSPRSLSPKPNAATPHARPPTPPTAPLDRMPPRCAPRTGWRACLHSHSNSIALRHPGRVRRSRQSRLRQSRQSHQQRPQSLHSRRRWLGRRSPGSRPSQSSRCCSTTPPCALSPGGAPASVAIPIAAC